MPDINIRVGEGCSPNPNLLWDTVWNTGQGFGDWAIAGPTESLNIGGLQATAALETAVILCFFTDRYCPPSHPLAKFADNDPRGYWGDGIDVRADLGEEPLGSLLWLLERSVIDTVETPRWARAMALDSLSPLLKQKVIVRADVQAVVSRAPNRLDLSTQLYGQDGAKIYDQRFEDVWAQIGAVPSNTSYSYGPLVNSTVPTIPIINNASSGVIGKMAIGIGRIGVAGVT